MTSRKRHKDKERYYLLAGMGGKSVRRKHKITLIYSLVAGAFVSALLALTLYLMNRR